MFTSFNIITFSSKPFCSFCRSRLWFGNSIQRECLKQWVQLWSQLLLLELLLGAVGASQCWATWISPSSEEPTGTTARCSFCRSLSLRSLSSPLSIFMLFFVPAWLGIYCRISNILFHTYRVLSLSQLFRTDFLDKKHVSVFFSCISLIAYPIFLLHSAPKSP